MMVTVAMAQAQTHTHLHELSQQWTHSLNGRPAHATPPSRTSSSASSSVSAAWASTPVIKFYLECLLRQQQLLEASGASPATRTTWVPKSTISSMTVATRTTPSWARPRSGSGSLQERRRPKSPHRSVASHAASATATSTAAAEAAAGVDAWNASASIAARSAITDSILAHDADQQARRHTRDGRGDDTQSSMSAVRHQQQAASAVVQHGEQLRMRGIQPSRRTNEIHIHIAPAMDTSVKHTIAS